MPRPLRVEYEGARYHVMNRGDRREAIYADDEDRELFLQTLGEACMKTGWQVHAYCLMGHHFHLILETPKPNLVAGMKRFLGTYTQRSNRRHRLTGHLFAGRYKAQLIDPRTPGYLVTAADYVHLNPWRARLVPADQPLSRYRWSSYPLYLRPTRRPAWLRVDRVLGEHGVNSDTVAGRRQFARRLEHRREGEGAAGWAALRRGWRLGAYDLADWMEGRRCVKRSTSAPSVERVEGDVALGRRLVAGGLQSAGWKAADLARTPKGHQLKVELARTLRAQTPLSRAWIAEALKMGSASYGSQLLGGTVPSKVRKT